MDGRSTVAEDPNADSWGSPVEGGTEVADSRSNPLGA